MSVYELQNVTVTERLNGAMYQIVANDGWCIHLPEHEEGLYKRAVILQATYDFSTVQIINVNDLPEGTEIMGGETQPEVM